MKAISASIPLAMAAVESLISAAGPIDSQALQREYVNHLRKSSGNCDDLPDGDNSLITLALSHKALNFDLEHGSHRPAMLIPNKKAADVEQWLESVLANTKFQGIILGEPYLPPQNPELRCNQCNQIVQGCRDEFELKRHFDRCDAGRQTLGQRRSQKKRGNRRVWPELRIAT